MKLAFLKETLQGENRVSVTPDIVKKYKNLGIEVLIEHDAGILAKYDNQAFSESGAILSTFNDCIENANVLFKVNLIESDLNKFKNDCTIVALINPYYNKNLLKLAAQKNITLVSLEMIPRISRAQNMDVLSSQSNIAGYRAVIEACYLYGRGMPLMMTAAGTITAAKVLIIGAGVAGLQAIATARRMGAAVSAFDVRKDAREQVESLGAKFVHVEDDEEGDAEGGYAKEMSIEYQQKQSAKIAESVRVSDIVITTALIPGKPAPKLVTNEMVQQMKYGSIIVDMATTMGGNCEGSELDKVVQSGPAQIIGFGNLASRIAQQSSQLFARNIFNLTQLMWDSDNHKLVIDLEDKIIKDSVITYQGNIDSRFQSDT